MAENVSIGRVLLEATTRLAVQDLGKFLVPSMTCLRAIGFRDERLESGAVVVLGAPHPSLPFSIAIDFQSSLPPLQHSSKPLTFSCRLSFGTYASSLPHPHLD